jgi:hypothetical protein
MSTERMRQEFEIIVQHGKASIAAGIAGAVACATGLCLPS